MLDAPLVIDQVQVSMHWFCKRIYHSQAKVFCPVSVLNQKSFSSETLVGNIVLLEGLHALNNLNQDGSKLLCREGLSQQCTLIDLLTKRKIRVLPQRINSVVVGTQVVFICYLVFYISHSLLDKLVKAGLTTLSRFISLSTIYCCSYGLLYVIYRSR